MTDRIGELVDLRLVVAIGAALVVALVIARLRGFGTDSLERVASWASARGLEYVPPTSADDLATFAGDVGGTAVQVTVARVARGFGVDLPPRLTTVLAAARRDLPSCTLQPAAWVLDVEGKPVGPSITTGDDAFDEVWAVRSSEGGDAEAVLRALGPAVRARLLSVDAQGITLAVGPGEVASPRPGILSESAELDRRLSVVSDVAKMWGR